MAAGQKHWMFINQQACLRCASVNSIHHRACLAKCLANAAARLSHRGRQLTSRDEEQSPDARPLKRQHPSSVVQRRKRLRFAFARQSDIEFSPPVFFRSFKVDLPITTNMAFCRKIRNPAEVQIESHDNPSHHAQSPVGDSIPAMRCCKKILIEFCHTETAAQC